MRLQVPTFLPEQKISQVGDYLPLHRLLSKATPPKRRAGAKFVNRQGMQLHGATSCKEVPVTQHMSCLSPGTAPLYCLSMLSITAPRPPSYFSSKFTRQLVSSLVVGSHYCHCVHCVAPTCLQSAMPPHSMPDYCDCDLDLPALLLALCWHFPAILTLTLELHLHWT